MAEAPQPTTAAAAREAARRIAFDLLAVRDRSVQEMRQRLERRGCTAGDVDIVVADLEALGLLDDRVFVRRWVETRRQRRPEGVPKITRDLLRRGVDKDVVEQVLAELDDGLGSAGEALTLLQRHRSRYAGLDATTAQRRMYGLLARRGFDADTARQAVERAWTEIEGTADR